MTYWRSPTWRLAYPWAQAVPVLVTLVGLGAGLLWPAWTMLDLLGLVGLGVMLAGLLGESRARIRARRAGHRGWYAVVGPRRWLAGRLRMLGYTAPVPGPVWELHVRDTERWADTPPAAAARAFRAALTADLAAWVTAKPPAVTLVVVTFNHPSPADQACIAQAGGRILSGPLAPAVARHFTPRRMRRVQRAMFGGVVSDRPRTDPATWTTWVVPADSVRSTVSGEGARRERG